MIGPNGYYVIELFLESKRVLGKMNGFGHEQQIEELHRYVHVDSVIFTLLLTE